VHDLRNDGPVVVVDIARHGEVPSQAQPACDEKRKYKRKPQGREGRSGCHAGGCEQQEVGEYKEQKPLSTLREEGIAEVDEERECTWHYEKRPKLGERIAGSVRGRNAFSHELDSEKRGQRSEQSHER